MMDTEFARNMNVNRDIIKYDTINILSNYTKYYNYPIMEMIDIKNKTYYERG